jgi:hypothetical protein
MTAASLNASKKVPMVPPMLSSVAATARHLPALLNAEKSPLAAGLSCDCLAALFAVFMALFTSLDVLLVGTAARVAGGVLRISGLFRRLVVAVLVGLLARFAAVVGAILVWHYILLEYQGRDRPRRVNPWDRDQFQIY